jgi:hypothetical protein
MLQHDTSTSVGEIRGYITWFTKTDDEPTSFTWVGSQADSWRRRIALIDTLTLPRYTRANAGPRFNSAGHRRFW